MQVEVAVDSLDKHLIWSYQGVEGPGVKGDVGGVDRSPYYRLVAWRIKAGVRRGENVMRQMISFLWDQLMEKIDFWGVAS